MLQHLYRSVSRPTHSTLQPESSNMLLFLALPLLLLQSLVTKANPSKHHKRWLGVQPLTDELSKGPFGPWPPVCTGQAVRYCFASTRSQRSSTDAMELGIWGTSKGKRLRVEVRGVEVIVEAPRPLHWTPIHLDTHQAVYRTLLTTTHSNRFTSKSGKVGRQRRDCTHRLQQKTHIHKPLQPGPTRFCE
jgi:hypothetical protein